MLYFDHLGSFDPRPPNSWGYSPNDFRFWEKLILTIIHPICKKKKWLRYFWGLKTFPFGNYFFHKQLFYKSFDSSNFRYIKPQWSFRCYNKVCSNFLMWLHSLSKVFIIACFLLFILIIAQTIRQLFSSIV